MKKFMDDSFLLDTETAEKLYNEHAAKMPIFDFHCHISVAEIWEDKKFSSITEAWLGGDHYKWRLMREMGIDEKYITGDAPAVEKFRKYAEIMPYFLGNPIYHWTHLELRRFFGINDLLSASTADSIYERANAQLDRLTAREMIRMSGVKKIYTTDDPVDDLCCHKLLAADKSFETEVYPAFRPDKALNIERETFVPYIAKLSEVSGIKIDGIASLCDALKARIDYFDGVGCVCSDHALDRVMYEPADEETVDAVVKKVLAGAHPTECEEAQFKGFLLVFLGREYARRGWVQQYHIGAMRNNSSRNYGTLGPDTGFDAIGDATFAPKLSALLDALDATDELPKTILYCLNPRENEVLAALMNCFQRAGTAGKLQLGSGWWFNDQKDGMEKQMTALSNVALISKFVGMLTDSRSFLSYTRHEYFRRILCNYIGGLVERGEYPDDMATVGKIVEDICYNNAINYFRK